MNIIVPGTKFTLDDAIAWLEFCCNEYYNYGSSPTSDIEYDYVVSCVKKIAPNHPFFTKNVRSAPNKNKVSLKNTVYSLDKIDVIQDRVTGAFDIQATFNGLRDWMTKLHAKFGDALKLYVSPKGDGLTGIVYYEKGKLVLASTGGDGQEGRDITNHMPCIRGVPMYLPNSVTCEVRGEIMLRNSRFLELKNSGDEKLINMANARNLAAGTMNLDDMDIVSFRKLDFYAWNLLMDNQEFSMDDDKKFTQLREWGFHSIDELGFVSVNDLTKIKDYYLYLNSVRNALPDPNRIFTEDIPMDGIVLSANSAEQQKALGFGSVTPNFSIALKFPMQVVETIVTDIEWQISRNGRDVPTIVFEPVVIDGSTVSRATGDNYRRIITEKIGIGCKVVIGKAGLTIPKVLSVVEHAPAFNASIPTLCPSCGQELIVGDVDLQCYGIMCPDQIVGKLHHFLVTINPDKIGISDAFASLLFEHKLVKDQSDFYIVSRSALLAVPGIGEAKANIFMRCIDDSKKMPLSTLLRALSIPNIGDIWANKLAAFLAEDGEKILSPVALTYDMASQLLVSRSEGSTIPINVMKNFCTWISMQGNVDLLQKLMQNGVKILCSGGKQDNANGTRVCITGKTSIPRNELEKMLRKHGYTIDSSVSKHTNVLVCNVSSNSAKAQKALKFGTQIITEVEMLARIGGALPVPEQKYTEEINNLIDSRLGNDKAIWDRAVEISSETERGISKKKRAGLANQSPPGKGFEDIEF